MNNQANSNTRFIRWACLFAPAVLILLLSGFLSGQSVQEKDKAAIRALVDKINRAWQLDRPSILFQEILSDKGFAAAMPKPNNPSEALVIDKHRFCELLDNMMQGQQRPQEHEHKVESITVIGPLAYEIGTSLDVRTDGIERRDEVMNVFAKDETGWKLIYSAPKDNVKQALYDIRGDEEQVRGSVPEEQDRVALRAVVDEMTQAWQMGTPSVRLRGTISDKGFAFAMPDPANPSEAVIVDKQAFCQFVDSWMGQSRPQKHKHQVQSITIIGPLAYELGVTEEVTADGTRYSIEVMQAFARDETGWKLIYSTVAGNIRKALALPPSDEQEVRGFAQEFAALFQLDNPEPFTRLNEMLAEDFFAVTSKGHILQDKASALGAYRKAWQQTRSTFEALKIRYDIQSIKAADDGAVVFGMLEIDGRLKDNNGPFRKEVWETLILRRTNGQWQIAQEHSTTAAKTDASSGEWIEGTR